MRKLILLLSLPFVQAASAVDRIVDITGTGGAFTTITAALTAAQDGDRILVIPHAGFFVENLSLTKSLQVMSAVEGQRFNLQGSITFAPATAGREITVQNVLFASGFGVLGSNSPAGTRTSARVLDCKLLSGNILFDLANYDVVFSRDSLMNGGISFRFGKVVGNYVSSFISCFNDASPNEDTNYIVGNRIVLTTASPSVIPIFLSNSSQYVRCENNYILGATGIFFSNPSAGLINMPAAKTGSGMNTIMNNTVYSGANLSANFVILANVGSSPPVRVWNNLITASGATGGIAIASSSSVAVHYNAVKSPMTISGTPTGTNILSTNSHSFITAATGALSAGADAIDAGDPGVEFTDLDLTRNDIGCYGGSFSMENFLAPESASTVVTFVDVPRRVLQGAPIDIKAEGFDR